MRGPWHRLRSQKIQHSHLVPVQLSRHGSSRVSASASLAWISGYAERQPPSARQLNAEKPAQASPNARTAGGPTRPHLSTRADCLSSCLLHARTRQPVHGTALPCPEPPTPPKGLGDSRGGGGEGDWNHRHILRYTKVSKYSF